MSLACRGSAGPRVACRAPPSSRGPKDQMHMRIPNSGSEAQDQVASRDHGL